MIILSNHAVLIRLQRYRKQNQHPFHLFQTVFLGARSARLNSKGSAQFGIRHLNMNKTYVIVPDYSVREEFNKDTDLFNSQLETVLRGHRHYFDRDGTAYTPDSHVRNGPQEWICLPAVAFASWARMSGSPVRVESPYMPPPATSP